MATKQTNIKTKLPIPAKIENEYKVIAELVECSPSHVKKVLNGKRSGNTELGQEIWLSKTLLDDGVNNLITSVKKAVAI